MPTLPSGGRHCGISPMRRLRSSRRSARAWPPRGGVPVCWPCRATTACGREVRCSPRGRVIPMPATGRLTGTSPKTVASPGRPRPTVSCCCVTSGSTRVVTRCVGRWRWSETTAVGSTPGSPSSAARSSRASTGWSSRSVRTLTRMSMALSPACLVSSSRTAGGTAGWSTVRFAPRSRPRSGCWKGCWRTSAQPVARRSPSRLDAGVRITSSNENCSGVRAPARWPTRPGCNSRFRLAGTTTCSVPWSTSVPPGIPPTSGWTKPSSCSNPNSSPTAPGCSSVLLGECGRWAHPS
jgi:hypothetical protein